VQDAVVTLHLAGFDGNTIPVLGRACLLANPAILLAVLVGLYDAKTNKAHAEVQIQPVRNWQGASHYALHCQMQTFRYLPSIAEQTEACLSVPCDMHIVHASPSMPASSACVRLHQQLEHTCRSQRRSHRPSNGGEKTAVSQCLHVHDVFVSDYNAAQARAVIMASSRVHCQHADDIANDCLLSMLFPYCVQARAKRLYLVHSGLFVITL
jgi:hypothetical protein